MSTFLRKHAARIIVTVILAGAASLLGLAMASSLFAIYVAGATALFLQLLWYILSVIHRAFDRVLPFEKAKREGSLSNC